VPTEKARKAAIALTQVGHGLVEGEPVNVGSLGWVKAAYQVVRQVADEAEVNPDRPLYESNHPYYSSDVPFRHPRGERHPQTFQSWERFVESGWADSDEDMNYVVRWDWRRPDPEAYADDPTAMPDHDWLEIFIVQQRKGIYVPLRVAVRESDEPEVRAWLKVRYRTVKANWEPLR
jgi:hypothetical protein